MSKRATFDYVCCDIHRIAFLYAFNYYTLYHSVSTFVFGCCDSLRIAFLFLFTFYTLYLFQLIERV